MLKDNMFFLAGSDAARAFDERGAASWPPNVGFFPFFPIFPYFSPFFTMFPIFSHFFPCPNVQNCPNGMTVS